jgi:hypothetical protein
VALVMTTLILTGTACSAKRPTSKPTPAPPRTAYDLVLDQVTPDGTVDTATALAAFSIAVAPLPGVPTPPGPRTLLDSGTAAVSWTLGHWKDLTTEQRRAVVAALTGSGASKKPAEYRVPSPSPSAPRDPDLPCQTADSPDAGALRPALDTAIRDIAKHLGRTLTIPVYLTMNRTQQVTVDGEPSRMYTWPCEKTFTNAVGKADGCTIHVNPIAMSADYSDHDRVAFLAHEAMHCYLIDKFGPAYDLVAPWLQEGIPIWVQTALAGGDVRATHYWTKYLPLDKTSLFKRTYDALGFYAQLANSGVNVWQRIDPMTQAYLNGGNAAAWQAAGPGDAFLRTWASGHARGARQGADWNITGYGIPAERPVVAHYDALQWGAAATAAAPVAGVDLIHLVLPANSTVTISGDAHARGLLGLTDGDHPLADVLGKVYCTKPGGCTCPESSAAKGATLPPIAAGDGLLAVTGGLKAAKVTIAIGDPAEYCARPPQCVIGTWTLTNGNVHYTDPKVGMTESGGAGMVMKIEADGTAHFDFSPMAPVLFVAAGLGIQGDIRYGGTATYHLRLPAAGGPSGRLQYLDGDLSKVVATARITKPFAAVVFDNVSVAELAAGAKGLSFDGQPLANDHLFECSSTTLVLTIPPGGKLGGTWTFSRR